MAKQMASCLLLGALSLSSVSAGCLLYTDHINHAPTVKIVGPTSVSFGMPAMFTAEAADEEQAANTLQYEWHQISVANPVCPDIPSDTISPSVSVERDLQVDTHVIQSVCVWVIVRDQDGATNQVAHPLAIVQRDPAAVLAVVKPTPTDDDHYPLYSTIQLTSESSKDTEMAEAPLTRQFTVTHAGKAVPLVDCQSGNKATDVCIEATDPGDYMVDLTVTDMRAHQAVAHKKLTVDDDAPPCIRQTTPQFGLPKFVRDPSDLMLEVDSVTDDGDAYPFVPGPGHPVQNLTFEWSWWYEGSTGAHDVRPDRHRPQADFNGFFHAGDQVYIRLRVLDSVRERNFSACDPEKPGPCAIGKDPTCYQWVTWKFDLRLAQ